jgi:hypothetical protein
MGSKSVRSTIDSCGSQRESRSIKTSSGFSDIFGGLRGFLWLWSLFGTSSSGRHGESTYVTTSDQLSQAVREPRPVSTYPGWRAWPGCGRRCGSGTAVSCPTCTAARSVSTGSGGVADLYPMSGHGSGDLIRDCSGQGQVTASELTSRSRVDSGSRLRSTGEAGSGRFSGDQPWCFRSRHPFFKRHRGHLLQIPTRVSSGGAPNRVSVPTVVFFGSKVGAPEERSQARFRLRGKAFLASRPGRAPARLGQRRRSDDQERSGGLP